MELDRKALARGSAQEAWSAPLCHALRRRIGRALARWRMIEPGDRVLVGLSGGKDSLVLLHALSDLRRRSPVSFDLAACTVGLTGMDTRGLAAYCAARDVPYAVAAQPIVEIIQERQVFYDFFSPLTLTKKYLYAVDVLNACIFLCVL